MAFISNCFTFFCTLKVRRITHKTTSHQAAEYTSTFQLNCYHIKAYTGMFDGLSNDLMAQRVRH